MYKKPGHSTTKLIRARGGFTLIELLIVIFIIGILAVIVVTNLVGGRERALDSQKKSNLKQLKIALNLYFINHNRFPETDMGLYLKACGPSGTSRCPVCTSADFASGGADGCQRIYAKKIELANGRFPNIRYYQCAGGDDFRLKVGLTNRSDTDIIASQKNCPAGCGTTYTALDFVLCNN